ncbi:5-formyltetrahydrofolate cyclo-ligase [Actinomadura craniellae]|uniref:5-formyltetrahydrofolate cyclo-ligase n=1 Tax=Actinomadura craniellae TaxID=2231787 RepID=A0A365GV59_9ACTN|nr:5-formyltetrahydrofolate cyclo-ligase [Actinomadura craniellae]RAY10671.1 5-formyltetrahydrofolate cyclo-ligase [Actinomadura craniellae]
MDVDQAKQEARERMWALLEREKVVHELGVHGHIPDFVGSEQAAELLTTLPAWQSARVVKSNPDRAQLPVRARALDEGKLVYMAVPRLADEKPFYELNPAALTAPGIEAARSKVAETLVPKVGLDRMRPIGLVICGTVAVNRYGVRLGKGAGYSDIEFALAQESGLIDPKTVIVTTVHPLQVVDELLPEARHDFRVDFIVTPNEIIACDRHPRPSGLVWDQLNEEKITNIPVLSSRRPHSR